MTNLYLFNFMSRVISRNTASDIAPPNTPESPNSAFIVIGSRLIDALDMYQITIICHTNNELQSFLCTCLPCDTEITETS